MQFKMRWERASFDYLAEMHVGVLLILSFTRLLVVDGITSPKKIRYISLDVSQDILLLPWNKGLSSHGSESTLSCGSYMTIIGKEVTYVRGTLR